MNYKQLTNFLFVIVFYFNLHVPNCVITVLCFYLIIVFLVATNSSFVVCGNNFLYRHNGIMFPSLVVSSLYCTVIAASFDDVFRFGVY